MNRHNASAACASVRRQAERRGEQSGVSYRHGMAERTGLPAGSQDLVVCAFTFHELPGRAAAAVVGEARRLCRPGGCLTVIDLSPQ